ncbi:MAG: hypothetical protein AAB691_02540 [Patescibacteria group bacterium]
MRIKANNANRSNVMVPLEAAIAFVAENNPMNSRTKDSNNNCGVAKIAICF